MWRGPTPINRDQQAGGSGDWGEAPGEHAGRLWKGRGEQDASWRRRGETILRPRR